jgi:hypothetical protein
MAAIEELRVPLLSSSIMTEYSKAPELSVLLLSSPIMTEYSKGQNSVCRFSAHQS